MMQSFSLVSPDFDSLNKLNRMWDGCKLNSAHCMLNIFSYLDYRHRIRTMVILLNKSGDLYFNTVVKSSHLFTDHLKSLFPPKHERVSINNSLRHPINVKHLKRLFIEALSDNPEDHQLASELFEANDEQTKFIIENVNFDIVSFEFHSYTMFIG